MCPCTATGDAKELAACGLYRATQLVLVWRRGQAALSPRAAGNGEELLAAGTEQLIHTKLLFPCVLQGMARSCWQPSQSGS